MRTCSVSVGKEAERTGDRGCMNGLEAQKGNGGKLDS